MSENHNVGEDKASGINPNEIGVTPTAKELKSQEKVDINQSELGRETSQMPADEHIEHRLSQIDEQTIALQKKQIENASSKTNKE